MRIPARLDVLRLRNFRNLFIGEFVSTLGDGLMPVALTFAVYDLTKSPIDVGIVLAASTIPLTVLTPVGGVWGDRLRREWVMIASDLVRCAVLAVGAVFFATGYARVWNIALGGFIYGCGDAFFFPAYTGLIQQIVPQERLQEANALRGMSDSFGWFVGPALSGVLYLLLHASGTFAIDAATFLVSAGFLASLRVPALVRTREAKTFTAEFHDGWLEVRSRRWLWTMMLRTMLVLFVTIAPLQVLGPLWIRTYHQSTALWGWLVGLFSLGMLAGGVIALYYRPRRPMVTVTLMGLTASAPMFALALGWSWAVLSAVWFLRGIAIGVLVAVWDTTLQLQIAPEAMARVSSWDWMTSNGLWSVGLVLAGPIAAAMGIDGALWLSGVLGIVFGLWVLLVKDVWRLRGQPREAGQVADESA